MFAKVNSIGLFGLNAFPVWVECDLSQGLPKFDIVGLPDATVKESRDRVRAALKNSGYNFPVSRIVVNIAPADIKKGGSFYDLPILIGILTASKQLKAPLDGYLYVGELSLDGEIKPINGVLSMAMQAKEQGIDNIFLPIENAAEGSVVEGMKIFPVKNVREVIEHLNGINIIEEYENDENIMAVDNSELLDFADVKGQFEVKRALEIAAAGGHNVIMIGPPGTGKSMLAKRIPSILPQMTFEEAIQTTRVHSVSGELDSGVRLITKRPFRAPHHTVSPIGLTGGGTIPRPGEMSLAHNGVLFLDELPEFPRHTMEVLRQPIEDGEITVSRASGTAVYPCDTMLICAMNPCPCGYFGHPTRQCTCSDGAAKKYLAKISGPLLDRLDIHVEVQAVDYKQLSDEEKAESSYDIQKRVEAAREIQHKRFKGMNISCNAKMGAAQTRQFSKLSEDAKKLFEMSFDRLGLSARAYDKILRISRTIADLDGKEIIELPHIAEAIQYRSLDRKYWKS